MALESEPHLDEEQAERYSLGALSEDDVARVEEHLLTCEACRLLVLESDEWVKAAENAGRQLRREPERKILWFPRILPVLAAAAAALALLMWVRNPGGSGTQPQAVAITLAANRGPGGEAHAPARKPLALQPDLTGIDATPPFALEIVDAFGARVWRGVPGAQAPPLSPGVYFVRIYSQEGQLRREYALRVDSAG